MNKKQSPEISILSRLVYNRKKQDNSYFRQLLVFYYFKKKKSNHADNEFSGSV